VHVPLHAQTSSIHAGPIERHASSRVVKSRRTKARKLSSETVGQIIAHWNAAVDCACRLQVDVDENEDVAQECGIQAMPTFQLYKNKEKVHEFSGASEEKLREAISKFA